MKKPVNPKELVAEHEKTVRESLEKHGLAQLLVVRFPGKAKPPLMGRLGAWLVNKFGGIIAIKYQYIGGILISVVDFDKETRRRK